MAIIFGEHAREETGPEIDEGEHPARISKAELPRDPNTGGFLESYGKTICDVTFALNESATDTVRRRYSISFGQNNTTGEWAAFAELLAAAVGIPCGAKNQRLVGTTDLEGQAVRVILKRVEKNGKSYLNVVNVLPPKGAKPPAPKPTFAFTAQKPALDDESLFTENDEIPF